MRKINLFFILVLILISCRKERELLTGDIMGRILVYNEDGTSSPDNSGVIVNLFSDTTFIKNATTDENGQYRLNNIGYGKYKIDLQKENYIEVNADYLIYHVGGYSPTIKDGYLYEIPDYILVIDSIKLVLPDYRLKVYLKLNGDTVFPFFSYRIVGYCSTTPEVSKDNYSILITGHVVNDPLYYPYSAHGEISGNVGSLNTLDKYYIRFYLLAFGQFFDGPINKKALGNPSNVISFKWQ